MGFSEAEQWWQEWKLRILVLFSLFLQYFLFMSSLLRKRCVPSWVRLFIWLAYLGSDAIAIYGLAALFNYHKENCLDVKVLWVPILLVHLGGQDGITAYNIEDNELWKRHVLTAISQVTVAVYVFWSSWSKDKSGNYLAAAILLFFPGILKCILKPWDLKRVSLNSLVDSSGSKENEKSRVHSSGPGSTENDEINSLGEFVNRAARPNFMAESSEGEVNKKPYDLFVDLAPPYSYRLSCLTHLVKNKDRGHRLVQSGLSATFDRLYTKESVLHQNFNGPSTFLPNCIDLVPIAVSAGCMLAVIFLVPLSQEQAMTTDIKITYILLCFTAVLEYLVPVVVLNLTNQWFGDQQRWPDQVAQYNLIWYMARNRKCKTKMLRNLATLMVCKDYLDQQRCMTPCKSSSSIPDLVHDYLKKGWTGGQITNMATYREFNDNRGQWTLDRENCRVHRLDWSLERPFDESVILWHLATDFCFHLAAPSSPTSRAAACRSKVMSNYMAYLLFVNPEMLMTGARRSLFREAYSQLEETLKAERSQVDGEGPSRQVMPQEETGIGRRIRDNIEDGVVNIEKLRIIRDAWRLAKGLTDFRLQGDDKNFRSQGDDKKMWRVIQGVWVEMLCFSAGRCRGYLHAKSLGQGGEYLSYVWLLMSYMGMETLGEKMQRTKLQEEASNNGTTAASTTATGGSSNGTTAAIPVPATGGDHGHGTTDASPVIDKGAGADDETMAARNNGGSANSHAADSQIRSIGGSSSGGANVPRQRKSRSLGATPVEQKWLHPWPQQPT